MPDLPPPLPVPQLPLIREAGQTAEWDGKNYIVHDYSGRGDIGGFGWAQLITQSPDGLIDYDPPVRRPLPAWDIIEPDLSAEKAAALAEAIADRALNTPEYASESVAAAIAGIAMRDGIVADLFATLTNGGTATLVPTGDDRGVEVLLVPAEDIPDPEGGS